ncbi:MAG: hypothetical protein WCW01_06500 [Gammaproteobacteria bacterium]|jgi:hypothetical protein
MQILPTQKQGPVTGTKLSDTELTSLAKDWFRSFFTKDREFLRVCVAVLGGSMSDGSFIEDFIRHMVRCQKSGECNYKMFFCFQPGTVAETVLEKLCWKLGGFDSDSLPTYDQHEELMMISLPLSITYSTVRATSPTPSTPTASSSTSSSSTPSLPIGGGFFSPPKPEGKGDEGTPTPRSLTEMTTSQNRPK